MNATPALRGNCNRGGCRDLLVQTEEKIGPEHRAENHLGHNQTYVVHQLDILASVLPYTYTYSHTFATKIFIAANYIHLIRRVNNKLCFQFITYKWIDMFNIYTTLIRFQDLFEYYIDSQCAGILILCLQNHILCGNNFTQNI